MVYGEPLFKGHDVASMLGHAQPRNYIRDHVPEKVSSLICSVGRTETVHLDYNDKHTIYINEAVNEAGLYRLVFRSNNKKSLKFTDWVGSEVLPSIRKH